MARKLTQEDRADFEDILIEMDFLIDDLMGLFAQCERYQGKKLDFSPDSLNLAEQFLLDFLNGEVEVDRSKEAMIVRVAYYYGEVVIRNVGGRWLQSDYEDESFGNPIVEGYSKEPYDFDDPFTLCWTVSQHKQPGTLIRAFRSAAQSAST